MFQAELQGPMSYTGIKPPVSSNPRPSRLGTRPCFVKGLLQEIMSVQKTVPHTSIYAGSALGSLGKATEVVTELMNSSIFQEF